MPNYSNICVSARRDFSKFESYCQPNGTRLAYKDETLLYLPRNNDAAGSTVVSGMENARRFACTGGLIMYHHDDMEIFAPDWHTTIIDLWLSHRPAVIGLGGATQLGSDDLYKVPYHIHDLARQKYYSGVRGWEVHGGFLPHNSVMQCAVIDGFFMAIDAAWLDSIGGWPVDRYTFHCYDLWLCAMAARTGREVLAIGLDAIHHGGGTSTHPVYMAQLESRGIDAAEDHRAPHRTFYNEFRDVLPIKVQS